MKISPKNDLALLQASTMLPEMSYTVKSHTDVTGEDLLLCDYKFEDGRDIIPEEIYKFDCPLILPVNHYKRLRKAFKRNGGQGVANYLSQFLTKKSGKEYKEAIGYAGN